MEVILESADKFLKVRSIIILMRNFLLSLLRSLEQ